jgi:hypothetical protein
MIPKGIYCYTRGQDGKRQYCEHFQSKEIGGVTVPFCTHLNQAGMTNSSDDDILFEYFEKDIDKMMEALPLDLLFDAVKECGVDNDFDERED